MSVLEAFPVNRAERRRQQSREQLKTAAAELLAESGYVNLTIRAITDRADLGYGTFYLHFADKDDVVWAVMHELGEIFMGEMNRRLEGVPFPRREYLSWVYLFEYMGQYKAGFVSLFGRDGSAVLLQRYQDYIAALHEYNLRAGHFSSALDVPPEVLSQFMAGALTRLLLWWCETTNDYTPKQMADILYQIAFRQTPPEEA